MNPAPPPLPSVPDPDAEHLRLIEIFHYVFAGFSLLGLGFLGAHFAFMQLMFANPEMWKNQKGGPPPAEFFAAFQWIYLFLGVCIVLGSVANFLSARFIRARRRRTFSLVVAGLDCAQFPLGTALGVFTFIILLRDSVRARYAFAPAPASTE